ncbi:class Ib ribonucleoside-diphosphate reductase assembly flavoprotein NrdI [Oerskovia sp. M15]
MADPACPVLPPTPPGEAARADAPGAQQTVVYFSSSSSGMVRSFAEGLGRRAHDLGERDVRRSVPTGPWVLITPSYKTGNVDNDTIPEPVRRFLADP